MAGFVDPAFKHIKTRQANFIVWRISKESKENYEAKQMAKECYGILYNEESYLVFSSTPVKKPLTSNAKGGSYAMEIHVHFWLGSKLSPDDRRRTTIKAMELDEVLCGAATLHREVEGHESDRFLSYFKDKIMIIRQGEMPASNEKAVQPKLYSLSERGSTILLTEHPSIGWGFLNINEIAVLETSLVVHIWLGSKASTEKCCLARKFSMMRRNGFQPHGLIFDGREDEATHFNDFQKYLHLKCKIVKDNKINNEVALVQTQSRKAVKLYKVILEEDNSNTVIHDKNGPLNQSDLNGKDICIVDHVNNGIWVWVTKNMADEERCRAINVGIAYLEKKQKSDYSEAGQRTLTRVVQGFEPAEFKLLFTDWLDKISAGERTYFTAKIARPVNFSLTAEQLENCAPLAAETQLLDNGCGKMKILMVKGTELQPLAAEQFGIFHSTFSYLVHYSYIVNGYERKILYYWLGEMAPRDEKECCIWPSVREIPELNDTSVQVRIEQFHETPHFNVIFQGKIVVLTRDFSSLTDTYKTLDDFHVLLLKVVGGDTTNSLSIEVEPRASSLTSYGVFILKTRNVNYIWSGLSSAGDDREMAKRIANKWARDYKVILEGSETEHFWKCLGGFEEYLSPAPDVKPSVAVPARAFKCSFNDSAIRVSEIVNFDDSDFGPCDIILVDAWSVIYVWSGKEVSDEYKSNCEKFATAYLESDPCCRKLGVPIILVHDGQEPPTFTGFFTSWKKSKRFV